jgi:hypothetical protein
MTVVSTPAHEMPQCPDFMIADGDTFIRHAAEKMRERRLKHTPRA